VGRQTRNTNWGRGAHSDVGVTGLKNNSAGGGVESIRASLRGSQDPFSVLLGTPFIGGYC